MENNLITIIKPLSENQRQYILRRIAGLDASTARNLFGIAKGTYNTWFHNKAFADVHKQLPELSFKHRIEAIQILRRDNQLEAVLLEGKMIAKMKEEIDSGELYFCRTNLAREVYSKLISDIDKAPTNVQVLSWQQRIQLLNPQNQEGGRIIDGEFKEVGSIENQHQESQLIEASEQTSVETEEKTQS
jgi:hypothetical protein